MRKLSTGLMSLGVISLCFVTAVHAQQSQPAAGEPETPSVSGSVSSGVSAPRLVKFGGVLKDHAGQPLSGVAGVTFALYKDQQGRRHSER